MSEQDEQQQLRCMIDELCDLDEGLSSWEVNFVESMSHWVGRFTQLQADKIRSLYEEKC